MKQLTTAPRFNLMTVQNVTCAGQSFTTVVGATLRCPNCRTEVDMHHYRIETFERKKEDAEEGLHVIIENGKLSTDSNLAGNPSLRRDGLKIYFECWNCGAQSFLAFAQHKGSTHVHMEKITDCVWEE